MKRLLCCGILAGAVVAAYVHWKDSQTGVYTLNVVSYVNISSYSGEWVYGPSWRIGSPPYNIGYEVRSKLGPPSQWNIPHDVPKFTNIEIGGCTLTIRGDACPWLRRLRYSAIAGCIMGFFMMLITPKAERHDDLKWKRPIPAR